MSKRVRLTAAEISAVLDAAGNCDAPAMFEDMQDEAAASKALDAYESGMNKLRDMLARKQRKPK